MGQKVAPLIFRSKIYPTYLNNFNPFINLKSSIHELIIIDILIKSQISLNILDIYFKKNYKKSIYCNIILSSTNQISIIQKKFNSKFKLNTNKIYFNFYILKNPLISATFILNYIIHQYKLNKFSLRTLLQQVVLLITKKHKIKGLKCMVSGRINGVQIAKVETFNFNKISLQCLNCLVRYKNINIRTKYGILGFKLWLFLS